MGKQGIYSVGKGLSCVPVGTESTMTLDEKFNLKKAMEAEAAVDDQTLCGIGSFKPKWLQKFASPKLFLFAYSLCGIVQGASFTYLVGCFTTMEKRFAYDSKMSGIIMISDEISPILLGIIVGYFGNSFHRPRVITFGILMGSLSCFAMSFPYFVYGARTDVKTPEAFLSAKPDFCNATAASEEEFCVTSTTLPAVTMFFFGNFLKGISGLVFYTIGTAYLDDSVKKKNSPFYLGTLLALRLLGPTIGFLLSSFCLQYYENPFHDPGFDQKDPRWIGAWWLGFVILGVAILIFSLPMVLFPRRFPNKKLPPSLANKKEKAKKTPMQELQGMMEAMKRLAKNPILVCHYLGGVLRLNGVVGYYVLLPKYMEMQFKQSASKASLYSGPASIIGMQIGILFGGLVIRKFRPRPRALTGGLLFAESFSVIALLCCMMITCPMYNLSGTTTMVDNRLDLVNSCNSNCSCTTQVHTPVCGPDGTSTYFSPCFAGCTGHNKTNGEEFYTDCKCVHDDKMEFTEGAASNGYCNSECQWMITFVVVLSLGKMLSSTARVGNTIVTLRCVDPKDKSIALGTLSGVFSLLAFIPYPLIYGALTDASCLVWEESCGETGNCWIYDVDKFRFLLHGVSTMFVFLGLMTDVMVWILSPRLKNLYDEDTDSGMGSEQDEDIVNQGGMLGVVKLGFKSSLGALPSSDEKPNTSSF